MKIGAETQAIYQQEAAEQLSLVEELILELELAPQDREKLNRLFRVFHTIKGSGSMFGFEAIASFTHHVESILDALRQGRASFSKDLASLTLASKDCISEMLEDPSRQAPAELLRKVRSAAESLAQSASAPEAAALQPTAGPPATQAPPPSPLSAPAAPPAGEPRLSSPSPLQGFEIQLRLNTDVFSRGLDPLGLLRELHTLGSCEACLLLDMIPPLEQLDPEHCHMDWDIRLTGCDDANAVQDVFIFIEDDSRIRIQPLGSVRGGRSATAVSEPQLQQEPAVPPVPEAPDRIPAPSAMPGAPGNAHTAAPSGSPRSVADPSVKVPSSRLDRLVSIVGELVINHSRLHQLGHHGAGSELSSAIEDLERLVGGLRDQVLGIRMMPIGSSLGRFRRLVRDLSEELGREVTLETSGEETELDKNMLDQIGEPLVHLIRNSIDHGIASPDERLRSGKPRSGLIRLSASHEGAHVVLRIADDGNGLDLPSIRQRALETGLLAPDDRPTDGELAMLIFEPGLSTARSVTSVSGRGVGMDVVKRQVEALHGTVSVTSLRGQGTTVTLTLPLTLAIIEGLLVGLDEDCFILPLSIVDENLDLSEGDCATGNARNLIALRGNLIPFVRLRELFGIGGPRPALERVVIVQAGDQRLGLVVDRILGTHQTVVQSLGHFYRQTTHVSGATILGDGRVALILDVAGLVSTFQLRGPRVHA